jgi:hypothetical protein
MMARDVGVLEIVLQISRFVACPNYDFNSQVFVQRADDSHPFSILGIPHIMTTTVDFTYRFRKPMSNIFMTM